jgi:hypothetical protein
MTTATTGTTQGEVQMISYGKKLVALAVLGASLLCTPALPAAAQLQPQDGLVDVAVGDVTIAEDVDVAVAAEVAAGACGVAVGPFAVLGEAVDSTDVPATVCENGEGPVTIEQN